MKITLKRTDLLSALNAVAVGVSQKATHPFSTFVLLEGAGGGINLTTDCSALRAEASVTSSPAKGFIALVSHSKLVALLQRESDEVSLEIDKDRLRVTCGVIDTHLSCMAADAFPASRPEPENQSMAILDGKTFGYALHLAQQCSGDGREHQWNEGILLKDDGKDFYIAGSNGPQVFAAALPSSMGEFETVLPAKSIRGLTSAILASEGVTLFVSENTTKITINNLTVWIQPMAKKFGNVRGLVESVVVKLTGAITVDRKLLIQALQTAAAMLDVDDFGVVVRVISGKQQALWITARSKANDEHREIISTKVTVETAARKLNPAMLIGHLRGLDCDNVTLHYSPDPEVNGLRVTADGFSDWSYFQGYMTL